MYKITIKGEAKTDYDNLSELDGVDCKMILPNILIQTFLLKMM
jgi:hypothetical protein